MAAFTSGGDPLDPAEAARLAAMQRAAQDASGASIDPGATSGDGITGGTPFVASRDPGLPSTAPGASLSPNTLDAMSRAAAGSQFIATKDPSINAPLPQSTLDAMNRAAGDANRQGSLGAGANTATTVPSNNPISATNALNNAASGGSVGNLPAPPAASTAPSTVRGITPPQPATPAATPAANPAAGTPAATPASPRGAVNPGLDGGVPNQNPGGPTQGTAGGGDLTNLTNAVTSQIQNIQASLTSPGTPIDATAVFFKQSQAILGMLDQQEAQMRAENEKAGTTVDPATQFAIDKLRENLQEQMKATRETLNSRGLYDSGILLELENRLQKGSASDQAQILSTRLSKLQDDLQKGLTQLRTQRYTAASQFGLAGANAQRSQDELSQTLAQRREQDALNAMLSLRGQVGQEATSTANRQSAAAIEQARLAEQQRQFNEKFGMDKAMFNEKMAADAAQNAEANRIAAMRRAAGGASSGTIPQIANPFGGSTKTPQTAAVSTNAAIGAVGTAPDRTTAINSLMNHAGQLAAAGVDIQTVMDAIDARFPPSLADSTDASIGGRNRRAGGPVE